MSSLRLPRRHMVGGMIGLAAGLIIQPSGPAQADGMMPMRAIRQFNLGDIAVTIIDDGSFSMGAGMFGSNAPSVFAVAASGHTHGHCAIRLESRDETLLRLVDTAVHYISGLERPDWTVGADIDKPTAVATRKRLLSQAPDEQLIIAGYHFPFPGVGRIMRLGDGFRYVPVPLV